MRTGGLISDWLGEVRIEEPELIESDCFGASRLLTWKGGRFELGYPLGMPLGVEGGIAFQVYAAGDLVAATTEPLVAVPVTGGELNWFEVIGVATRLVAVPQPNVLERTFGRRVELAWAASVSDDVRAYRVYADGRSGTVDYGTPVGEVDAAPGGVRCERYRWTSPELESGTWKFGIRAVDAAGNVQTSPAREVTATIGTVPDPPAGLAHAYDPATHKVTLAWTAPEKWE